MTSLYVRYDDREQLSLYFQPVSHENFQNMQCLTTYSGTLSSFSLEFHIEKKRQQPAQEYPSGVNESKLYLFFVALSKNIYFSVL